MAEFIEVLQSFKPCTSEKLSNLELMENQNAMENLDPNDPGFITLSNSIMFDQIPMDFPGEFQRESSKEKAVMEGLVINLPSTLASGVSLDNQSHGRKKRKRNTEQQKPKEVVHVRAKRGQATDSHSLAERVRRERINEKLRCLQDLVPGCYKTMGMAVMLEVIINYVQSLQNQIEFLSMKLSAASMYCDLNLTEMDAAQTETMQGQEMPIEVYGGASYFNSNPHGLFDCDS